jgi:hypothetical protein
MKIFIQQEGFIFKGEARKAGEVIETDLNPFLEADLFYHFTNTKYVLPVEDITIRGMRFKGVGTPKKHKAPEPEIENEPKLKPKGKKDGKNG